MEIKSTEFFRNMKKLPPPHSTEFKQLVDWEVEKCLGGVTVGGVFFSPWLYFHLNHWHLRIDGEDEWGNGVRIKKLPDLRDNEWIRAEALERCRQEKKGYLEIGLRQGGKSEFEASNLGYNALLFENTQNVIVGGNTADINLLKDKIDFGLKNMWEGLAIPRLDKTWKGDMIRLGYKQPKGDDEIWSYMVVRNANDGQNTEAAAGTTAKSFIMDEIGKYPFSSTFEAAKPALQSKFGLRAIPILVGTGGSFDKGENAERLFYHPEANNFLSFTDEKTGQKTCLFMSGIYGQAYKEEITMTEFLRNRGELTDKHDTKELDKINIWVANEEKALKAIYSERESKKKDPDQTEYLKAIMYAPLNPQECFLTAARNMFNVKAAKMQQQKIHEGNVKGFTVKLINDGSGLRHEFTDDIPIQNFPHRPHDNLVAPIIMWEPPIPSAPKGLYVAGVDCYTQDTPDGESLGAVYIFKRIHHLTGEKYQDMFVACYVARTDPQTEWNETARNLIKYYNAIALVENDQPGFVNYMINKNEAMYLQETPKWLQEVQATSTTYKRPYGISMASDKIKSFVLGCLKNYLEEEIPLERDEEGTVIRSSLGYSKVLDPMLLEEIIKYNADINVDRVIAASLAVALANRLDMVYGSIGDTDSRVKEYYSSKPSKGVFSPNKKTFNRQQRLFK